MRVLVANTPRMYRESLALAIRRQYPNYEVLIADPDKLDGKVETLAPHALVRDDDGVQTESPDGVVCWVGIIIDNHLNARISVDGRISEIHDVSLDELFAALGEAEALICANDGQETTSQETTSQETTSQETTSQETTSQETTSQE
jgi:ribosomal protein L12E/L44/L45/RPP1/RPP2